MAVHSAYIPCRVVLVSWPRFLTDSVSQPLGLGIKAQTIVLQLASLLHSCVSIPRYQMTLDAVYLDSQILRKRYFGQHPA